MSAPARRGRPRRARRVHGRLPRTHEQVRNAGPGLPNSAPASRADARRKDGRTFGPELRHRAISGQRKTVAELRAAAAKSMLTLQVALRSASVATRKRREPCAPRRRAALRLSKKPKPRSKKRSPSRLRPKMPSRPLPPPVRNPPLHEPNLLPSCDARRYGRRTRAAPGRRRADAHDVGGCRRTGRFDYARALRRAERALQAQRTRRPVSPERSGPAITAGVAGGHTKSASRASRR